MADSSETDDLCIPSMPTDDWEMNVFLKELADGLNEDDLKTMKHFISGYKGTKMNVLEKIKDSLDFFQHLRHRLLLTRDNIVILQALLWHLGRKDLHNKFVKWAKRRGNVIHFYAPNDKPENGYEYIKFHIGGKEKMNRNKLEELRTLVSRVLCIPLEFVVVTGIEATNSILVTFMVPEGYSNILFDLDEKDQQYIASKDVDEICCEGQIFKCTGSTTAKEEKSINKDEEVQLLLIEKLKLENELGHMQIELLKANRSVRSAQLWTDNVNNKFEEERQKDLQALIQHFIEKVYTPSSFKLQGIALRNAMRFCNHTLKKIESLGYDTDLIRYLLDANSMVTRCSLRTCHSFIERQQQQMITGLKHDNMVLGYQKDKLAYFLKVGMSNPVLTQNEEYFLKVFPMKVPIPVVTPGHVDLKRYNKILTDIFEMMEIHLNEKEKEALVKKYLSTAREAKAYKESKRSLLEYLWLNKRQKDLDFQEWMIGILIAIKRMDLADVWTQKANEILHSKQATETTKSKATVSNTSSSIDQSSGRHGKGKKTNQTETKQSNLTADEMNERLKRMEDLLERNTQITEKLALESLQPSSKYKNLYSVNSDIGAETPYDMSRLWQSKTFDK